MISHFKSFLPFLVFFVCFLLPEILLAQDAQQYIPLVNIPGVNQNLTTSTSFNTYINALYIFAITAGALLAVLKLVGAGVKYMFSDIVTNKESAKNDIKGALLGLLLIIGAVVILSTVNTSLTTINLNLGTLSNLPAGNYTDIRIIISILEYCDSTPGCVKMPDVTETQCDTLGGYFIPGCWLGYVTSCDFKDSCLILPPEWCSPIPPHMFSCTREACTCYLDGVPIEEDGLLLTKNVPISTLSEAIKIDHSNITEIHLANIAEYLLGNMSAEDLLSVLEDDGSIEITKINDLLSCPTGTTIITTSVDSPKPYRADAIVTFRCIDMATDS